MRNTSGELAKLRERTSKYEEEAAVADAIFLSIGDGAIATDEHGKIVRINQPALDLLDLRRSQVVGKWFPKVVVAYDEYGNELKPMQRPIAEVFITGKPISTITYYKRKTGDLFPAHITVSPIKLQGEPIGAIQVFRDVSREHEIDRMKSEFISIASHQLRTPLSAIKTYAYMLFDGYAGQITEQQREFMRIILTSVFRMNGLISTLLNVTRIETGSLRVVSRQTNLVRLIKEILNELMPRAYEKHINIKLEVAENFNKIKTDRLLTREVMVNLISNAIKYTPEQGNIAIKLSKIDDEIVFSVEDDGYGIPPVAQEMIFTKFYRANNIQNKETAGTGLGLYLVKGIVANLGGRIWFDSQENHGTTFYFTLPTGGVQSKTGSTILESS